MTAWAFSAPGVAYKNLTCIPKSEIIRLLNKFDEQTITINPDIIILDKEVNKNIDKFKNDTFCLIFKSNRFKIYSNNKLNRECLLSKN